MYSRHVMSFLNYVFGMKRLSNYLSMSDSKIYEVVLVYLKKYISIGLLSNIEAIKIARCYKHCNIPNLFLCNFIFISTFIERRIFLINEYFIPLMVWYEIAFSLSTNYEMQGQMQEFKVHFNKICIFPFCIVNVTQCDVVGHKFYKLQ